MLKDVNDRKKILKKEENISDFLRIKRPKIFMKQRIEWVDILKGIAIFLVVYGHVEVYSEKHLEGFFYRLQDCFCMPLFFFLSGLFAKPQYSVNDSILCLKKKFIQLMIPFLVCGSLRIFFIMSSRPWWALFWYPNGQGHCGYWFLLVLFELYVLFTLCQTISRNLTKNLSGRTFFVVALIIECFFTLVYILCLKGMVVKEPWQTAISFGRLYFNFPFFILGYLFMRNQEQMAKVFSKWSYNICLLIFACLFVLYDKFNMHLLPLQWILALTAVIVIVSLCRSFEDTISTSKNKYKSAVKYIGRHTLEIYVLHYFFIPRNMIYLRGIIVPDNIMDVNIILELIINSFVACAIIAVTLCCAFLISENAYLKQLFFGKH